MVEGFPLIQTSDGVCLGCLVGKHPEKRYEVGKETRAVSTLNLIHSDVLGLMNTTSNNGSRYFLTFYWRWFKVLLGIFYEIEIRGIHKL